MITFKIGDKVRRFREPTMAEWDRIGIISLDDIPLFNEFVVEDIAPTRHNGIQIGREGFWYPSEAFELVNQEQQFKFML